MTAPCTRYGAAARALSRGYLVPDGDFHGTVQSVFAHVCNLAVGERLLTVQDSSIAHTPTSIRVAGPPGARWSPPARAGQPVRYSHGLLRIAEGTSDEYTLDLSMAPVWAPRPAKSADLNGTIDDDDALACLAVYADAHQVGGVATTRDLARAVDLLQRALASCSLTGVPDTPPPTGQAAANVTECAAALIGMGPGLTPAGDDVLVGVLAALTLGGGDLPAADAVVVGIRTAITTHGCGTTDISRHYLRLAADGHFSQPLTDLVDAITAATSREMLRQRMAAVLAVGASSGADALTGVALGMSAVACWRQKQSRRRHTGEEAA